MATGSGIAAQFGIAAESVFGTFVAPTRFYRVNKFEIKKKKTTVQGGGLAAGQLAQPGALRVVVAEAAEGSVELEVPNKGFGLLLAHAFGATPTLAQQGATAAWMQTVTVADNIGKFLSLQGGVPNRAGTVVPIAGLGSKISSIEFSCERGGLLTCTVEFDARQESEATTLAVASYAETGGFTFKDLTVKLGSTIGGAAAVTGVKKVSLKLERGMDDEAYYAGSAGLKAEQVMNDWIKVSGSIDADFIDKAVFNDRFASDTATALVLNWTSPLLAAPAYPFSLNFDVPQVFFDSDTPTVDGPDITSGSFGWTAQYDLTNPIVTGKYVSTDTAA